MSLRKRLVAIALLLALPIALGAIYRPDRAIRVGTITVADVICAKTFVSGLDPELIFAETMERPGLRGLRFGMRYDIDRDTRAVEASVVGLFRGRSEFHDGFGCVMMPSSALITDLVMEKPSSCVSTPTPKPVA